MKTYIFDSPNIGKYRELKKYTEKYWKNNNIKNLKNLIMISKKIKFEKIFYQINNNFLYINYGDFSYYDKILNINCIINSFENKNIINLIKYFSLVRGNEQLLPCKMTKYFNTNYHYILPNNFNNLFIANNFLFEDLKNILKIGINPNLLIVGAASYLYISNNNINNFKKIFEIYILIFFKIKNIGINYFQIDEPILACKINSNWKNIFLFFYKIISKYFKIILNCSFKFNKDNDFIIKYNFSMLNFYLNIKKNNNYNCVINKNLSKINVFLIIKNIKDKIIFSNNDLKYVPYNLKIENFKEKKFLSFFFQKINELKLIKNILSKKINSFDLLYLNNFILYNYKINIKYIFKVKKNKINKINKINKKLIINNSIGSFPQNKEIKISRKIFSFFFINKKEYNNILKENIYLCILKQIKFNHNILVHGEFERTDMVEYFSENINGIYKTRNGWIKSYGTRYVKPPIILNIIGSNNITEKWFIFIKNITKKNIKIVLSGPITILKWSFYINEKIKFLLCYKLSEIISNEILILQNKQYKIFQIDEPTIKECLNINKKKWTNEINNFLFCFNNCVKNIKINNEIHSHVCYSNFNDIINFICKMNIDTLTIESSREKFKNLKIYNKKKLNLGAGIYDVHSAVIPVKFCFKNNILKFINKINFLKILINPDCGLKTRNWYELNNIFNYIKNILKKIKNIYF
ncbi:MAG: hypothetical protein ACSLEH_00120 [Candidatus Carsonella ruddii]